nr:thrombospondin type-1 domain-containing protein 4 isoform X1 [Onthophagus taurus]
MRRSKFVFRVLIAFILLNVCLSNDSQSPTRAKLTTKRKYPSKVYEMYKERLLKTKVPKVAGVWSAWSQWSSCSRTCGGGIMYQIRNCVSKPDSSPNLINTTIISGDSKEKFAYKHRKRRHEKVKKLNHCVGLYKRIHLCNNQECPFHRDFRAEQCASFNHRPFKGIPYIWEPYIKEGDECALNCLAIGGGFYATLNQTVIDGTSCFKPTTNTGKSAPLGIRGVCVEGHCKVVESEEYTSRTVRSGGFYSVGPNLLLKSKQDQTISSNGIIGALDESQEECAACSKGNCKNVSGLYTRPDLTDGYNFVAQIPPGACRILVQQLKPTRNIIALRHINGTSILNGDWMFANSKTTEGAGTKFNYRKQDATSLETITSPGPTNVPVEIMIVAYQQNPGIKYGYSVPPETDEQIAPPLIQQMSNDIGLEPRRLDVNHHQKDEGKPTTHRRIRPRRRFAWKITGLGPCTKTCGGGVQTPILTCVREISQTPVLQKRCNHLERPPTIPVSCNTQKCPEINWGGHWGPCTGSCGEGVQNYLLKCMEEEPQTGRMLTVDDGRCPQPKPTASSRSCTLPSCENSILNALPQTVEVDNRKSYHKWHVSPWSQCSVTCGTGHRTREVSCPSTQCRPDLRPTHAEHCDEGPCPDPTGKPSNWLLSEWSQCSETCGTGNQTRRAHCYRDNCNDDDGTKPETVRACSSDKECSGRWFTGPWGPCSDTCDGQGREIREVLCVIKVKGQTRLGVEMMCPGHNRPESERSCRGHCNPTWYSGEWSICDGNCPEGSQSREVRCFDVNGRYSAACNVEEMPNSRRDCVCNKKEDHRDHRYKPVQDEPPVDRNCVDKVKTCHLAVQARLCRYDYYTTHCCVSCNKAGQDLQQ